MFIVSSLNPTKFPIITFSPLNGLNSFTSTSLPIFSSICQSFLNILSIPGDETSKKYWSLI